MTTIEKKAAELAEIRAKLDAKVSEYNEAKLDNKPVKEVHDLSVEIDELAKAHAATAKALAYAKFGVDENGPMFAACRDGFYPAIKVSEEKIEDTNDTRLEVQETTRKVDLGDLHKAATNGIGKDTKWIHAVEKLNHLMTARRAIDLGADSKRIKEINDSYRMSQIARDFDLGKNPCSNTKLLDTIRSIVTMMLGEEYGKMVITADVNYLKTVFARADSKSLLKVKCANHKQMRVYMLSICHRVIVGGKYDVDFQVIKN